MSIKFSKKIFYEFYQNKNIKEIYDSIKMYQENINSDKFEVALENLNNIIYICEQNKDINIDFEENENVLDILRQYSEKIKKKIENKKDNELKDKNGIKNNDIEIKKK